MLRGARQFIGILAILVLMALYMAIAFIFSELFMEKFSGRGQLVFFALIGLCWIIPLLPVVSWMGKTDEPRIKKKKEKQN